MYTPLINLILVLQQLAGVENILATEFETMFEMKEADSITMIDECDSDDNMENEKKNYTFI